MKRIPRSAEKAPRSSDAPSGADRDGVDVAPYEADRLPPHDADLAVPADAVPGPGAAPVDIAAAVAAAGLGGAAGSTGTGGAAGPAGTGGAASRAGSGATSDRGAATKRPAAPSRRQQRRYARERAVQALYQWHMTGASSSDVRREFLATQDMGRVDVEYFEEAFRGVTLAPTAIDDELAGVLDRELAEVDPIERAILRLATWELRSRPDTPALVVINEGVEIAKRFCAEPGYRYVNGVLDRLATLLRAPEMSRA